MLEDAKEVLATATGPGDLAVVLLAGAVGFVADAALNVVGFLEPGYTGITCASTALGVKKALEARFGGEERRMRRRALDRARRLRRILDPETQVELFEGLDKEILLLESGVVGPAASEAVLDDIVERFRNSQSMQA